METEAIMSHNCVIPSILALVKADLLQWLRTRGRTEEKQAEGKELKTEYKSCLKHDGIEREPGLSWAEHTTLVEEVATVFL